MRVHVDFVENLPQLSRALAPRVVHLPQRKAKREGRKRGREGGRRGLGFRVQGLGWCVQVRNWCRVWLDGDTVANCRHVWREVGG